MGGWASYEIRDAGMRAGEIIAYRGWVFREESARPLHSVAIGSHWPPNGKMEGDVRYHGVYSFKEADAAYHEMLEWIVSESRPCIILGSVWIWGRVVEHARGYRSEFARMRSFDGVLRPTSRAIYQNDPALDRARQYYRIDRPSPTVVNSAEWTGR